MTSSHGLQPFTQRTVLLIALAGLWLLNLPIFLAQHLTPDAVMFDLQARTALEGGVLYQDILEPNLPGVVWVHMAVRSLAGWSSFSLRAFDWSMLLLSIWLLGGLIKPEGESRWSTRFILLSLAVTAMYFSLTEWCHCQRDAWLLPPSLLAVTLHLRRVGGRPLANSKSPSLFLALMEGMLWGSAFWIKPHVALPILCLYAASLWSTAITSRRIVELMCVVAGGALVGGIGSAWLIRTSAWGPFWDMQLNWNPEYLQSGRRKFTADRLMSLWETFLPWSWAHLAALALAGSRLWRAVGSRRHVSDVPLPQLLLSALYLGWMVQALAVQHPFAYVQVPATILALGLLFSWTPAVQWQRQAGWALAGWGLLALVTTPLVSQERLNAWKDCVFHGSTLAVRSEIQQETLIHWADLVPVLNFLRSQNLQDGELTAHTVGLIHLYRELDLRPPTRFVCLSALARLFPSRVDEMRAALENSKQKLVVTSLREAGMSPRLLHGPDGPQPRLPNAFPPARLENFPYSQSVVFRSGEYVVFRVDRPLGSLCSDYSPLRAE